MIKILTYLKKAVIMDRFLTISSGEKIKYDYLNGRFKYTVVKNNLQLSNKHFIKNNKKEFILVCYDKYCKYCKNN